MQHRFEEEWKICYRGDHFSKEVMYKLLVASIFPEYDKILISDVDVVFLGDVSEAYFALDAIKDDAYIAGVKPIGKVKSYLDNYAPEWTQEEIDIMGETCGGFLVMNLKKIREDNVEEKFLKSLVDNAHRLNQMEQDILNVVCVGKIKHLHLKFVACTYMWDYYYNEAEMKNDVNYDYEEIMEAMTSPVQLHYATGIKPWKNVDCTKSEIWFQYITRTPLLNDYLKWLPSHIVTPTKEEKEIVNEEIINVIPSEQIIEKPSKVKRVLGYIKRNPLFFIKKDFYKKVYNYARRKLQ